MRAYRANRLRFVAVPIALLLISACQSSTDATLNGLPNSTLTITETTPALSGTTSGTSAKPTINISGLSPFVGTTLQFFRDPACTLQFGSVSTGGYPSGYFKPNLTTPGTYVFTVRYIDGSTGVTSPCSNALYYTLLPTPTPTLISMVTPSSSSSYTSSITVQVTGAATGHTVNLYSDSACTSLLGSTTATGGPVLFNLSGLTSGAHDFHARAANEGGYPSSCSGTLLTYTLLAPPVPTGLSFNSSYPSTGYSVSPLVQVTGLDNNLTVGVYTDSQCTRSVGSSSTTGASTSLFLTFAATGTYTLYANTSPGAGAKSACSAALATYTLQSAPVPTSLTLTYPSSSPAAYSQPEVTVGGLGNGLTAQLYSDSACSVLRGTGTAGGSTALVFSNALTVGNYTFYAKSTNGVSTSACSTTNVAYSFVNLPAPSSLTLAVPSSSPSYYQNPKVTVAGVNSNDTVKLFTDTACTQLVGSASSTGTSVSFNVTTSLPIGTSTLYATTANSISGGYSTCSTASLSYTVTSRAPFYAEQTYALGHSSSALAWGDFNGDGKPDVFYGGSGGWPGGFLAGNGNATFQATVPFASGLGNIVDAVSGDFNGDGKLDVALVDSQYNRIRVLLGNGNGSFQSPVDYTITGVPGHSETPVAIAVADLNGDGKLDLVVATGMGAYGSINVLFGNSDGTFQSPVPYAASSSTTAIAIGDVDRDGHPDVAVTTQAGNVSVFRNQGAGTFAAPVSYGAGTGPTAVTLADVNGDLYPDILVATNSGFSVLQNTGSGTFSLGTAYSLISGGATAIATGDIDADGHVDVVVSNSNYPGGSVAVFFGLGNGTFDLPLYYTTQTGGKKLIVQDLDGDGDLDIIQLDDLYYPSSYVSVLVNKLHP